MHSAAILLCFFIYVNITKLLKFKMAAERFKLIRSLADIAVHIFQIKRKLLETFSLKHANEYFFVNGHSNQRVDYLIMWE